MSKKNPLAIYVPPGTIIEGRFLFETLAVGRYSTIFKVEDKLDYRRKYCIKVEYDRAHKINYLHQEITVLHKLATRDHMARLYYSERCDQFSFMLITLFGKSIWLLRQNLPNKLLSPGSVARIAVHTLYQIKQIHEVGYILRDLKIGDMLVGLSGKRTKMVFLVDFGMCRTYIRKDPNGSITIRPPRKKVFVHGILRYCSPRVHKRHDVCRADDLWSLVYVLIDLTAGLPWRDIKLEIPVAEQKETITDAKLFSNCPEEWIKIMEHVRSLHYESRPNYKLIYDCLRETLIRFQVSYSDPWDWDLVGNDVIIEEGSKEEVSSSESKSKKLNKSDFQQTGMETDHSRWNNSENQNFIAQDLPTTSSFENVPAAQRKTEVMPQAKNPFKEIISTLQNSLPFVPMTSSDQKSSALSAKLFHNF
uniref:Protein kinase domain-containing protein n=1 Tax=Setaria digitata TaxID=48799 RepID=A0A915PL65_9BILA